MITTLLFDLGGVLLTNGWDRAARVRAAVRFGLDVDDVQDRHEHVVGDFETGRMTLKTYLEYTVFFEPRAFSEDAFEAFMFEQSQPLPDALDFVHALHRAQRYRLAVVNNESRELNEYRIRRFHLHRCFSLFFSSCYVGLRKPDQAIYRLALDVMQTPPDAAVLVDDRAINVESARHAGLKTVVYRDVPQLRACLDDFGVH